MKKLIAWLIIIILLLISGGYLRDLFAERPIMVYPPAFPNQSSSRATAAAGQADRPIVIATALITPQPTSVSLLPTPIPRQPARATPLPDYTPGRGLAVLKGEKPYALNLLPGGWQAFLIGPSSQPWGYVVDITPLEPAVNGAHVEYKILPEYSGVQWVDVLWLRSPEIEQPLPLLVDLLATEGWNAMYKADVVLTPGEWMGFAMFPVRFDQDPPAPGVLDINVTTPNQQLGTAIQAFRVQPEFPGEWLKVARVQLAGTKNKLDAQLVYYTPNGQLEEALYLETTLALGVWTGWSVAPSAEHQGYLVEVTPVEALDNEISNSTVQPEFNGETWQDVLRVFVPEGRPRLDAVIRVFVIEIDP